MMAAGSLQAKDIDFLENAPTEPIENNLTDFAEELPVGFGDVVRHHSIVA